MTELRERYQMRLDAIEKHQLFLCSLIESKPKNKYRRWFVGYTKHSNKVFETEQEEYEFVSKYHRNQWGVLLEKGNLTIKEKDELAAFAADFGAMDY
jgi:hypothetical protein